VEKSIKKIFNYFDRYFWVQKLWGLLYLFIVFSKHRKFQERISCKEGKRRESGQWNDKIYLVYL